MVAIIGPETKLISKIFFLKPERVHDFHLSGNIAQYIQRAYIYYTYLVISNCP